MMRVLRAVTASLLVGLVAACSGQAGGGGGEGATPDSVAASPAPDDAAALGDIKRQVIAYVAQQNRFDPDDVVGFDATVKSNGERTHPAFAVSGSFQVKTSQPSNINEAVSAHVNSQLCIVDAQRCADGQYRHTVYFEAQAQVLERLDHSKRLDISQRSSVDKSFGVIAQEQARWDALKKQAVATGMLEFTVVKLVPPVGDTHGRNAACVVTFRANNQTNLPLWGLNGTVTAFGASGEPLRDSSNSAGQGFLQGDEMRPGQSVKVVVVLPCQAPDSIAKWELGKLQAKIGHGLPTAGMDASFHYSYPDWSQVVAAWREGRLPVGYVADAPPAPAGPSPAPQVPKSTITPATIVSKTPTRYPVEAVRLRHEGTVMLRIVLGSNAMPVEVSVDQTSGFRELDDAARDAVSGWRFRAAMQGEQSVESSFRIPVTFSLNLGNGVLPSPAGADATQASPERPSHAADESGPSFDCGKASTPTEAAICANPDLAALDGRMGAAYRARISAEPASSDAVRQAQRAFIREREARCAGDVRCIRGMLSSRLGELQ